MRVAELVRSEAATYASLGCDAPQVVARSRGRPGTATGLAVDNAEQRADRHTDPMGEPRTELVEAPLVHADLAPLAAISLPD